MLFNQQKLYIVLQGTVTPNLVASFVLLRTELSLSQSSVPTLTLTLHPKQYRAPAVITLCKVIMARYHAILNH